MQQRGPIATRRRSRPAVRFRRSHRSRHPAPPPRTDARRAGPAGSDETAPPRVPRRHRARRTRWRRRSAGRGQPDRHERSPRRRVSRPGRWHTCGCRGSSPRSAPPSAAAPRRSASGDAAGASASAASATAARLYGPLRRKKRGSPGTGGQSICPPLAPGHRRCCWAGGGFAGAWAGCVRGRCAGWRGTFLRLHRHRRDAVGRDHHR